MRKRGSRPSRSRQKAIIAVVVVFPCAPATTIACRARRARRAGRRAAGPRPGLRTRSRRRPPSLPAARAAPARSSTSMPSRWREVRRLDPVPAGHLGAPSVREERVAAHAGAADPGEPDAPTGERLRGRRAHRRSPSAASGFATRASRAPSRRGGRRRRAAPRRDRGARAASLSGTTTAPPASREPAPRSSPGGRRLRKRRHEQRRQARSGQLPDGAAGARETRGRRRRSATPMSSMNGSEDGSRARDAGAEPA